MAADQAENYYYLSVLKKSRAEVITPSRAGYEQPFQRFE